MTFQISANRICSFGAILAWKSDDDTATADGIADNDHKSDPYMSPSYAGDTINEGLDNWASSLVGNKAETISIFSLSTSCLC